ncbi:DUF2961 domain-containing protein [Streptomyces spiralis]|uniref:DUF2961 domain-containing protein n=1 Tax=Streptomyces spiralis TaxID=66376 RepID=UPI003F4D17B0
MHAATTPSRPPRPPGLRKRLAHLLAVCLTVLAAGTVAAPAASAATPVFTAKGPVGWDTLRHLDAFDIVPRGVQLKQFSSFDRKQGNLDQRNCLRTIGAAGCVMAEATGPGEIDQIWLTSITNGVQGDVSDLGNLVVVLDGTTVINSSLQSVVNGSLGAPFVYPLVANASQSSGGVHIDVPMTYTSSMLVYTTATPDPDYYHVDYRTFADASGVTTFDPSDRASDVLAMLNAAGTADPKPAQSGATTSTTPFTLAPGASTQVASVSGPAALSAVRLKLPQLAPPPSQLDPADDGRAFGSGGSSRFTVAIDPANQGVRLTRRLDQSVANQVADVLVNGTRVARWTALSQSTGRFVDQSVDLPASVTAGRSQLTITNQFVSSAVDFNEFTYWADSVIDGGLKRTDTVNVGDSASESGHSYAIAGQTWSGTRDRNALTYAANSVPLITDDGRAFGSGGSSRFTVAIDPANTGVRLTRRFDSTIADQVADVTVDGSPAGKWTAVPTASDGHLWVDQTLDLPASLTAGKSKITVANQFVSSAVDFNEFTYQVDSTVSGGTKRTDTVDVGDTASESAHAYTVTGQTWSGSRTFGYTPTGVLDSNQILASARIRISFDGTQTVDAPLGEFFGSSQYDGRVRSLMTGMDPGGTGWLSAWWPMPFSGTATVSVYNGSNRTVSGATAEVTSAPCSACASQLSAGTIAHFHATSHAVSADDQKAGQDYRILHAAGHGKFAGVALGMTGPSNRAYLEGNEHVYVDGSATPDPNGTGTEDYFNSGWYFINGPYTLPLTGNPSHQAAGYGCPANTDCTSAYRLTIQDAVPFTSSITYDLEHGFDFHAADGGHGDDVAASFSSTAFWYGDPGPVARTTDTLNVGDTGDESAHSYTSADPGTASTITATYEGNDGTQTPVTATGRATTASTSFTLAVDPANTGVVLRRTGDQSQKYQKAAVSVDGQSAGTWLEPLGNADHAWLDDTYQLPPSLTQGKSKITVTVAPVSGSPAWSASRYQAVSTVPVFTDTTPPATVAGAKARATGAGTVGVTWAASTDDAAVDHYAVYAAQNAAPAIDAGHQAGTTAVPSFVHAGLTAGQTWHYRVVALDAAGNASDPSSDVQVTVTGSPVKYWVDTSPTAPVYASPTSTTQTGTLNAGTNYVYCKVWGRQIGDATAYNHWWLKTDPDTGPANQYVSAYYLSRWGNDEAKDNNGTVIPDC